MPFISTLRKLFAAVVAARRPLRKYRVFRLHLVGSLFAGTIAAAAYLAFYYLTLAFLPPAFDSWTSPHTLYPFARWAYKLDLSQWIGSFIVPPWPEPFTWWIGLAFYFGGLVFAGFCYALLLSWDLTRSTVGKGIAFSLLLFFTVGITMWVAGGLQPAVMRNALPDVGFFFFGWSGWATLQVLAAFLIYGYVLSTLYRQIARYLA